MFRADTPILLTFCYWLIDQIKLVNVYNNPLIWLARLALLVSEPMLFPRVVSILTFNLEVMI